MDLYHLINEIPNEWADILQSECSKDYFHVLNEKYLSEVHTYTVFPPPEDVFAAFSFTPFHQVRVVILGQDPYHGFGQANGLSFSVSPGILPPPSLRNIFKELSDDLQFAVPFTNGDLTHWAKQGVFLLNSVLSVRSGFPASHRCIGWETFTDAVMNKLSDEKNNLVFMLWGNYARSKVNLIDQRKHLVLEAPHPSPLARGGFFGSRHFSKANEFLLAHKINPINWELS